MSIKRGKQDVRTTKASADNDFVRTEQSEIQKFLDAYTHTEELKELSVLDPCVGDGSFPEVLKRNGFSNINYCDIIDRGYEGTKIENFLESNSSFDFVIMNPPFSLLAEFMQKAIDVTREKQGKVAIICRLAALESAKRAKIYRITPPSEVYVCTERAQFTYADGSKVPNAAAFAWICFDHKNASRKTELKWL